MRRERALGCNTDTNRHTPCSFRQGGKKSKPSLHSQHSQTIIYQSPYLTLCAHVTVIYSSTFMSVNPAACGSTTHRTAYFFFFCLKRAKQLNQLNSEGASTLICFCCITQCCLFSIVPLH